MKLFITGGSGLIGSAFIHSLDKACHVTVLTRDALQAANKLRSALCDITYVLDIDEIADFDGYQAVINLAGEPIVAKRWSDKQKQKITQSRLRVTEKLVTKIMRSSQAPAVFISGSAIGFYGRQQNEVIKEDHLQLFPEFSHLLCKEWEDIAYMAQSEQTRVCLLRTGIVLDKSGGALAKMLLPFTLGLGGKIGTGQQYMAWIHLQDMLKAIHFLLNTQSCAGAYNLTAPHPVTNLEFSQTLARVLHRPCLFPVPAFVLKLAMGEMSDLLLYGQNVIPARLSEEGFQFDYPKLQPALENILGG